MKMIQLSNFKNVHNDDNSQTKFENLNEKEFLLNLFTELRQVMGNHFEKYSFYIFSTHVTSIMPAIVKKTIDPEKSVLFYISEETGYIPYNLKTNFKAIFKTYMPYEPGGNIHSFTLGHMNNLILNTDSLPEMTQREINIFFSGNFQRNRYDLYRQYNKLRFLPLPIMEAFIRGPLRNLTLTMFGNDYSSSDKKSIILFTHGFKMGLPASEYKKKLLNTKVLLCPKGFVSPETFRLLEGLNAGCAVISERLPDLEIYKNIPVIQVNSWKEGLRAANDLLSDLKQLSVIQQSSIDWWLNNCSYSAVAKRIEKKINNVSNADLI